MKKIFKVMAMTMELYPSQSIEVSTVRGWAVFWLQMANEFGFDQLEAAVARHMLECEFFPLPANLKRILEAMRTENLEAAARTSQEEKFIPCEHQFRGGVAAGGGQCVGGAWVFLAKAYTDDGQEMYGGALQRWAKDCDCLIAWRGRRTEKKQDNMRASVPAKEKAI
jgi:hypothetical protein